MYFYPHIILYRIFWQLVVQVKRPENRLLNHLLLVTSQQSI